MRAISKFIKYRGSLYSRVEKAEVSLIDKEVTASSSSKSTRFNVHFLLDPTGVFANGEVIDHTMYSDDQRYYSMGVPKVFRRDIVRRSLKQMGLHLPRGAKLGTEWTEPVESQLFGYSSIDPGYPEEVDDFDTDRHDFWTIDINGVEVPVQPGDMVGGNSKNAMVIPTELPTHISIKRMLRYRGKLYRLASLAEAEMERLFKEILPSSPFSNHVFAVGGYVRDEIMGLNSKDLDVVIDVKGGAKNLAEYIHSLFPAETSTPRQLGKGYPIWFIAFKEDVQFEGKTYRTSGAEIDIAESQKEGFPDPDSRQRDVEFGTINEDMERRDFTVNQLMKDMTTGEVLDLSGTGVKDIKNGILRTHPNVSPDTVFKDDPLRMMRLVRFMAKYGWNAAPEVVEAVRRNAHRISIISGERLQGELNKIMNLGKTAQAMRFMQKTGLLKHILPEIEELRGVEQSKEHHSEGDVFKHTMKVLENAKPTPHAQLAALFHDSGKPATQKFIGDKIQFLGHEEVSGQITEAVLRRLKYDLKTIKKVRFLVENHMRPTTAREWSQKAVRKFIRDIGEEIEDLLDLHDADSAGSINPDGTPAKTTGPILREKLKEVQKIPVRTKPILDGKTVMKLLDVSSGPDVGRALRWLQDKVDEYASEGKDLTPEEASKLLTTEYKR